MERPIVLVLISTGFTFFMTALGASALLLMGVQRRAGIRRLLLGLSAGVMLASSVWSLLIPAISFAEEAGIEAWVPAAVGTCSGILFLILLDMLLSHSANRKYSRGFIFMIAAIMLHNIPEGMAVALSAINGAPKSEGLAITSLALALSVGIQNFPEGMSVALRLSEAGIQKNRAIMLAAATGLIEPIVGLAAIFLVRYISAILPWLYSFAAGAMLYVVVEELIPEANMRHNHQTHSGTFGFMTGFLLIMILNVAAM